MLNGLVILLKCGVVNFVCSKYIAGAIDGRHQGERAVLEKKVALDPQMLL